MTIGKRIFGGVIGLGMAALLAACVITTDGLVFGPEDYAEAEGFAGVWRQIDAVDEPTDVEGTDTPVLRVDHLGAGRYRATPLIAGPDETAGEAAYVPDASEEPIDFSVVAVTDTAYIIVMTETHEAGIAASHAGLTIEDGAATTWLFGGGEDDATEEAFADAIAAHGLSVDDNFQFETRLSGEVTPDALKGLFADLLADPQAYGGYWTRYERIAD